MQAAAKYASQNYVATNGENGQPNGRVYKDIYFIHNPPAQSRIGELMTAVYQKVFEGNIGSLGNSTIQVRDLMLRYGRDDLFVGSHSRGTTVVHNGVDDLARDPANRGALSGTELKMVGPATHVANADRQYVYLQGDSATPRHIQIENNANDFVGSQIGGNPPTMHDAPAGQGWWGSIPDIFGSPASAHNCYGLGNQTCRDLKYRYENNDFMRPMQTIDQLPPTPWSWIYPQNLFLPPVYQPKADNNGEKP